MPRQLIPGLHAGSRRAFRADRKWVSSGRCTIRNERHTGPDRLSGIHFAETALQIRAEDQRLPLASILWKGKTEVKKLGLARWVPVAISVLARLPA
jgi:hypothetical protein